MISFLKLIRLPNLLMVLLTMVLTKYTLIHNSLSSNYITHLNFIFLLISVLSITAGGYIVNDIFDVEADRINKPSKVIIENSILKKNAWISYLILTSIGLVIGGYLAFTSNSFILFLIFIFSIQGLFIYSSHLKKKVLLGNLTVSFFVALSIGLVYITNSLNLQPNKTIWEAIENSLTDSIAIILVGAYMFFSFLTTLIREIIKDIEDIKGDKVINAKTLPIVLGRKRANRVALGCSILLILMLIIILKDFLDTPLFLSYGLILILTPTLYFSYKLFKAETKKDYHFLSNLMKIIMLFGILSMLLFKLN